MRFHPGSAVLVGLLLVSLPHCSSTYTDLCEKQKGCEGGNDKDVDACVAQARGAEEIAAAYDCLDAYDKQVDCLAAKAVCRNGKLDESPCKAEEEAVEACEKAASGKKD